MLTKKRGDSFSFFFLMISTEQIGVLPDGSAVLEYRLVNARGNEIKVCEWGAALTSVQVPDRQGKLGEVTLGFDSLAGWLSNQHYFGTTTGRFANRIRAGRFTLDGVVYQLATNNEPGGVPCHLHGGWKGFDKVLWQGEICGAQRVEFRYESACGEEGYPGNLKVLVSYEWDDRDQLTWSVEATTDSATIVNIVNHTYWNLTARSGSDVLDHELCLDAAAFLPTDHGLIPTGERRAVAGTPLDFTDFCRIGDRIDAQDDALQLAGGYDHCWIIAENDAMKRAAVLRDPVSGRRLTLWTNQPAVQFYSGNFLDGSMIGKAGQRYARRSGLCLETQKFPDSPNQMDFPSTVLRAGEVYQHRSVYQFDCMSTEDRVIS